MFGTNEPQKTSKAQQPGSPVHPAQEAMSTLNPGASKAPSGQPAAGPSGKPAPPLGQAHKGLSTLGPISMSQLQAAAEGTPEKKPQVQENRLPAVQSKSERSGLLVSNQITILYMMKKYRPFVERTFQQSTSTRGSTSEGVVSHNVLYQNV